MTKSIQDIKIFEEANEISVLVALVSSLGSDEPVYLHSCQTLRCLHTQSMQLYKDYGQK